MMILIKNYINGNKFKNFKSIFVFSNLFFIHFHKMSIQNFNEITDYYKNEILPLKDEILKRKYQIVFTGCICAAKTTILNRLFDLFSEFKPYLVHEYLEADAELGELILNRCIYEKISALTMQNCILDIYENELNEIISNVESGLIFYERIPDDNLAVFANLAFKDNRLSTQAFEILYSRTIEIDKKYNIPSYICKNSTFKRIVSNDLVDSILIILKTIKDDILNNVNTRIIGLSVTLDVCQIRLKRRNRKGEEEYKDQY